MITRKANRFPLFVAPFAVLAATAALCTAQDPAPPAESAKVDPASAGQQQSAADKPSEQKNPRRPETFRDALDAAGDDGVIVFCYGPDWNQRSVRMLESFWKQAELEKVTGQALLVAVPIYEYPTDKQAEESQRISAGMPSIPFNVCPTIMMVDKTGSMYANLPGMDFLGNEKGSSAFKNIASKLAEHRKLLDLMKKADSLNGMERAKVLGEIGELSIEKPDNFLDLLKAADPNDSTGLVRRNTHSALQFLYKLMDTKDGFLKTDFHTTLHDLMGESMKVINDKALRAEDRQAAYCLLIGQARREEGGSRRMKDLITASMKIDPNSFYGRAMPRLSQLWGNERANETSDERRDRRAKEKEDDKKRRIRDREVKKTERNTSVE